jgi:hypothetical protein
MVVVNMKVADKIERMKKDSSCARDAISCARKIDAEYEAYYDAASEADLAEEKVWAGFGVAEMAALVR